MCRVVPGKRGLVKTDMSGNLQIANGNLDPLSKEERTGKTTWRADKLCTRLNTLNTMQWDFMHSNLSSYVQQWCVYYITVMCTFLTPHTWYTQFV